MMSTQTKSRLWEKLKPFLYVQLIYIVLTMTWNIAGIIFISKGMRALGPTASLPVVGVVLLFGIGLVITLRRWPVIYCILSAILMLLPIPSIVKAFTTDPALWPSDFWRYAGAALNVLGVLGSALAVIGFLRRKNH